MSTPTPGVPAASSDAYALLSLYHPPTQALEVLTSKVANKPLALHPTAAAATTTTTADARSQRRQLRDSKKTPSNKPAPLSAKEKRALAVHRADPATLKLAAFAPLHALWLEYARTLAELGGGAMAMAGRLASGDLHGALVEVVKSRAVDRVGLRGVVVKETRGALVLATEAGGKTVPKEFTVFRLEIEPNDEEKAKGRTKAVFDLHGNQLGFRASDRAGRKFKSKPMLDL